jgi:signal transduction histidine kinase
MLPSRGDDGGDGRRRTIVETTPPSTLARKSRSPSAWLFLAVFAGVVLSFLGATLYARFLERAIHDATEDIAGNAAPSIEHLGKAGCELRHGQALVEAWVLSKGSDHAAFDELARARARTRAEAEAYLALPTFPGEREAWQEVALELRTAGELCDLILLAMARGDPDAADLVLHRLRPAVNRGADALERSVEINAAQARRLAQLIEVTRRRSVVTAGALDGLSAVLALGGCGLLHRAVRHHAAQLDENRRLIEARAEELDLFAGRVAHDVMSPVGVACLAFALTDRSLPAEHPAKATLARGQRSLQGVQRLIDGLLELARAGARPGRDARAEVRPILDETIDEVLPAAQAAGVELRVEPFEACAVACSEGVLASLVSNLVRNAVKYMGDRPERRVTVRVWARSSSVRIEVADTGPGIHEELHAAIFQPYVRATASAQPGLGLGLATVKRIVDAHGGSLDLVSSPGNGSLFRIDLPRAARDARGAFTACTAPPLPR